MNVLILPFAMGGHFADASVRQKRLKHYKL